MSFLLVLITGIVNLGREVALSELVFLNGELYWFEVRILTGL